MVSSSAIIPIASLSAIVVVGLVFIIWWFPRAWNKGNAEERAIVDQQAQYLANLRAQQAETARVNRATGDDGESVPPSEADDSKPPAYVPVQPKREYRPPVAGMF